MWRQLEGLSQRVDERVPPLVVDVVLAAGAASLITFIVRSIAV